MKDPAFLPTHRVANSGTSTGQVAGATDGPRLDPWLEVEARTVQGEWTQVRCSNGWEAWVPRAAIESIESTTPLVETPRARRKLPLWPLFVAALFGAAYLLERGSRNGTASKPTTTIVSTATSTAKLAIPPDWTHSPDGLSAAATTGDLINTVPTGPRVRGQSTATKPLDLAAEITQAALDDPRVLGDAVFVTVGGKPAVATEFLETDSGVTMHRIYLVVRESEQMATSYVLEATQAVWDAGSGRTLRTIAGLPPK